MKNKNSLKKMALLSFFIAILIIQTFIPWLGYLPLGPASITIVPATVILGAILLGPTSGSLLGLAWGLLAISRNLLQPGPMSPVFINPLVALPGRMLVGGLIGLLAKRRKESRRYQAFIYGALGSIINTVVTMSLAYFFAKETILSAMGIHSDSLLTFIIGIIVANGMIEALVSSILVGLFQPSLEKVQKQI